MIVSDLREHHSKTLVVYDRSLTHVRILVVEDPRREQVAGRETGTAFQRRIASITARLEIPLVDPLPELREAYALHGPELFIAWDGHNGAVANGVIARALRPRVAMLPVKR